MTKRKRQPQKLASATAYRRLAWKAAHQGNSRDVDRYNSMADRLMRSYYADKEHAAARAEAEAKWRERARAK